MRQKILKNKLETELAAYRRQEEHKHSFMCRKELWKIESIHLSFTDTEIETQRC